MSKLYLSFPQWQGSGKSNEIFEGGNILTENLKSYPFKKINIPEQDKLLIENNILGYQSLKIQLTKARDIVNISDPREIFTVGGGCDVEIIPVSCLNQIYTGNLVVIWIDAHGDLNTPESSPSKNLHGMPLRLLLGDGDIYLKSLTFSTLKHEQIVLFGTRDLDEPEKEYVAVHSIEITMNPDELIDSIRRKNLSNAYIHLDLDAIDPGQYPYVKVPTANGLNIDEVKQTILKLKESLRIVGGSVVEYSPGPNGGGLETAVDLAETIFG